MFIDQFLIFDSLNYDHIISLEWYIRTRDGNRLVNRSIFGQLYAKF